MGLFDSNPYAAGPSSIPADIAPQYSDLDTQRKIMAALLMSSMSGGGTEMAGKVAIRTSPLTAIARLLTGYMANKSLGNISEQERTLMEPLAKVAEAERKAKMQGFTDAEAYRASLREAPIFGVQPSPTAGMPSLAPTVANAATLQQNQASAAAPGGGLPDLEAQYTQMAQYWAQQAVKTGNPKAMEEAQKYAKAAHDARDKYSTAPQVVMDASGRPTYAQFSERGGPPRITSGVTPPPDTHIVDLGDKSQVVDYRALQPGQTFTKGMSPEAAASNRVAWANYGLNAANQNKPQIITGTDGAIYAVDPRAGTGAPVMTAEGTPLNRGEKPLTESQAKAAAFVSQMTNASKTLAELEKGGFTGATPQQQVSIANAGATGIPYVPGSAAAQRFFSSDQAQKYDQAQLQWTEGALRFMTGANAPETEVRRNVRTYFPQPGDSSAVIEQKAAARKNMEESVRLASGTRQPTKAEIDAELRKRGVLK